MHSPWYRRLMDRVRSHSWWPIHYKARRHEDGKISGSWWVWRGKYYFYRPGDE